ncbi:MAG: hypothetical protein ACE5Q3_09740 [Alphaproteobacteria bacterium]
MELKAGEPFLRFSYSVGIVTFDAEARATAKGAYLYLTGDIAPMPYSVESKAARRALRTIVRESWRMPWGSCTVSERQRILVHGRIRVDRPVSPFTVIAAAIEFAVRSYPLSQLILDQFRSDVFREMSVES